jgi:hypothetical protein
MQPIEILELSKNNIKNVLVKKQALVNVLSKEVKKVTTDSANEFTAEQLCDFLGLKSLSAIIVDLDNVIDRSLPSNNTDSIKIASDYFYASEYRNIAKYALDTLLYKKADKELQVIDRFLKDIGYKSIENDET